MRDCSEQAGLIEEVIRRVLRQYQENLHLEDYQRRALDDTIRRLPSIVEDSAQELRLRRARARPLPGTRALRQPSKG